MSFIARAASFLPKTLARPFSRAGLVWSATASVWTDGASSSVRRRVTFSSSSSCDGQELVQRRVDQADHDRQAVHGPEQPGEVIGLQALELCQRRVEGGDRLGVVGGQLVAGLAPVLGLGGPGGVEDHALHGRQPLLLEEHVLRPAQPDALRPEGAGPLGVARVIRVGPDLQAPDLIGPGQERGQVVLVLEARLDGRQLAGEDLAGGAVDADHVALADGWPCRPSSRACA